MESVVVELAKKHGKDQAMFTHGKNFDSGAVVLQMLQP